MAGVLSFSEYIGGPDEVVAAQAFPSDQKSYLYNFGIDITGWTVRADYQTIVVDAVSFNRYTGQPNFSNSRVIGFFPREELTNDDAPEIVNAATGLVKLKVPAGMYTGPIRPDARNSVPVVVVALTWTDAETYANTQTHRWAFVQAWEPEVTVGDPSSDSEFQAL
jgi:hypothetical protein